MHTLAKALCIAVLLPLTPAWASTSTVACVQAQMAQLGFDAGPVDGQSGPKTRMGVDRFVDSLPDTVARQALLNLPKFSKRASAGWCRELARLFPQVQVHLPSLNTPLLFAPSSVSDTQRIEIQLSFRRAENFLREHFDVRLASQVELVVADGPDAFREQLRHALLPSELPRHRLTPTVNRYCGGHFLGAAAFRNHLAFCWRSFDEADPGMVLLWQQKLDRAMVHEFVHHMQRELSNDKVQRWIKKGTNPRRRIGPPWMVEGTAEYIEQKYTYLDKDWPEAHLDRVRDRAQAEAWSLRDIRKSGEVRAAAAYDASRYAATLLAMRHGEDSLIQFWRAVGETDNWFTAFERVYGLPIEDFEALYEVLREDRDAAMDFVAGVDLIGGDTGLGASQDAPRTERRRITPNP